MFHPKGPTLRELAVQALSSTERGYDLLAPKFDYTPFRTPDAVLRPGGRLVFVTSPMPPPWSARYWLARGFNAAMHVRNLLVSPPFVMYYLTFLLPDVEPLLRRAGLAVEVRPLGRDVPNGACVVTATRPPA